MGFDQLMLFYNHYTVASSRMTAQVINTTAFYFNVGLMISGSTSTSSTTTLNLENGEMSVCFLQPKAVTGSCVRLTRSVNCGAFQGLRNIIDDPDMRGDAASNPTEQLYFVFTVWDPIDASVPVVSLQVNIEFDVIFHEPKKAPQS